MKHTQIKGWADISELGRLVNHVLDHLAERQQLKIAEVGVYFGRGTVLFNEILHGRKIESDYYAIDTFEGSVEHKAWGQVPDYEKAKENIHEHFPDVQVLKFASLEACQLFQDSYFDIVYIDAAHDYLSVTNDIKAWLPKVRKGGCICGDDYISGWPEVIRAVDDALGGQAQVIQGTQQWFLFL
jgi:predicted O-methyltransferase YrrM